VLRGLRIGVAAPVLVAGTLLAGGAAAQEPTHDPVEPVNRAIFEFNRVLDGLFLEPAARLYRIIFPSIVRDGVRNVLTNLRTPVVLANDLLQGKPARAEVTFGRFMINTIVGVGGVIDVASWAGMDDPHDEDFGQTLAVWGVGERPYLMLPLFGPSNPRDAAGLVVDILFDPFTLLAPTEGRIARTGTSGVDFREQNIETIEELERTSLDFYAATRTFYRQSRASAIRDGAPAEIEDIYDESLYDDPAAADGGDAP